MKIIEQVLRVHLTDQLFRILDSKNVFGWTRNIIQVLVCSWLLLGLACTNKKSDGGDTITRFDDFNPKLPRILSSNGMEFTWGTQDLPLLQHSSEAALSADLLQEMFLDTNKVLLNEDVLFEDRPTQKLARASFDVSCVPLERTEPRKFVVERVELSNPRAVVVHRFIPIKILAEFMHSPRLREKRENGAMTPVAGCKITNGMMVHANGSSKRIPETRFIVGYKESEITSNFILFNGSSLKASNDVKRLILNPTHIQQAQQWHLNRDLAQNGKLQLSCSGFGNAHTVNDSDRIDWKSFFSERSAQNISTLSISGTDDRNTKPYQQCQFFYRAEAGTSLLSPVFWVGFDLDPLQLTELEAQSAPKSVQKRIATYKISNNSAHKRMIEIRDGAELSLVVKSNNLEIIYPISLSLQILHNNQSVDPVEAGEFSDNVQSTLVLNANTSAVMDLKFDQNRFIISLNKTDIESKSISSVVCKNSKQTVFLRTQRVNQVPYIAEVTDYLGEKIHLLGQLSHPAFPIELTSTLCDPLYGLFFSTPVEPALTGERRVLAVSTPPVPTTPNNSKVISPIPNSLPPMHSLKLEKLAISGTTPELQRRPLGFYKTTNKVETINTLNLGVAQFMNRASILEEIEFDINPKAPSLDALFNVTCKERSESPLTYTKTTRIDHPQRVTVVHLLPRELIRKYLQFVRRPGNGDSPDPSDALIGQCVFDLSYRDHANQSHTVTGYQTQIYYDPKMDSDLVSAQSREISWNRLFKLEDIDQRNFTVNIGKFGEHFELVCENFATQPRTIANDDREAVKNILYAESNLLKRTTQLPENLRRPPEPRELLPIQTCILIHTDQHLSVTVSRPFRFEFLKRVQYEVTQAQPQLLTHFPQMSPQSHRDGKSWSFYKVKAINNSASDINLRLTKDEPNKFSLRIAGWYTDVTLKDSEGRFLNTIGRLFPTELKYVLNITSRAGTTTTIVDLNQSARIDNSNLEFWTLKLGAYETVEIETFVHHVPWGTWFPASPNIHVTNIGHPSGHFINAHSLTDQLFWTESNPQTGCYFTGFYYDINHNPNGEFEIKETYDVNSASGTKYVQTYNEYPLVPYLNYKNQNIRGMRTQALGLFESSDRGTDAILITGTNATPPRPPRYRFMMADTMYSNPNHPPDSKLPYFWGQEQNLAELPSDPVQLNYTNLRYEQDPTPAHQNGIYRDVHNMPSICHKRR